MTATADSQANSTKKLAEHPSYENMIIAALSNLKERNGSSRPAVKKYILANYKVAQGHFGSQISTSIRRGVTKNVFSLPKGISGKIKLVKPERKTAIEKKVVKKTPADKTKKAISVIKKKKTTSAPKKAVNKKKSAAIKKKPTTAPKVNKTTVATA